MNVNDFLNSVFDESPGNFLKPMHFKVGKYAGKTDKEKHKDYISIELVNDDDEVAYVRQYLNKNDDGTYKQHIYAGGKTKDGTVILPSVTYELIDLAKQYMGEPTYEEIKSKHGKDGKVTKAVIEQLEFEIPTKRIKPKDGSDEILMPMFAYQRQQDEKWRQENPKTGYMDEDVDVDDKDVDDVFKK